MAIGKILLFLFLISVGKSPDAAREFAQIRGEWTIVHVTTTDSAVTPEMLPNRLIFSAAHGPAAAQPSPSIKFSGQLKPNRKPKLLEVSSVTYMMGADEGASHAAGKGSQSPQKPDGFTRQEKIFAIYRVTGDTMKLLIKPAQNGHAEPPKDFVITAGGREILLELRRKP